MEEITKKILKKIKILRTTPNMLISISTIDYQILRIYVEGLINGIDDVLDIDLMLKITHWFKKKVNEESSMFWINHIRYRYKDKTDDELKVILLDTLEEFLEKNPNWYTKEKDS